ncbi:MAG: hypothetical protein MZV65_01615 [Chromatiales bacterium]|nr:hypothetical protein [Chromatiales bacterium]
MTCRSGGHASEANSFILQATLGCSFSWCSFCSMYRTKQFVIRPLDQVHAEIQTMARVYPGTRRVFLADGDALAAPTEHLRTILGNPARRLSPVGTGVQLRPARQSAQEVGGGADTTAGKRADAAVLRHRNRLGGSAQADHQGRDAGSDGHGTQQSQASGIADFRDGHSRAGRAGLLAGAYRRYRRPGQPGGTGLPVHPATDARSLDPRGISPQVPRAVPGTGRPGAAGGTDPD